MNTKIVTKATDGPWMGRYGERRIHVNETLLEWRWGFMIPYFRIWIGVMRLGPKKTRGIEENEF